MGSMADPFHLYIVTVESLWELFPARHSVSSGSSHRTPSDGAVRGGRTGEASLFLFFVSPSSWHPAQSAMSDEIAINNPDARNPRRIMIYLQK
jgi:hypothetical protein